MAKSENCGRREELGPHAAAQRAAAGEERPGGQWGGGCETAKVPSNAERLRG